MSEEKLYAVKNDEGKYWDIGMPPWWDDITGSAFKRIDLALRWAKKYDGHIVTLIEEPEKVVLSKEQAKIVENARDEEFPATYISDSANLAVSGEEELLMKAYVNGYTVAKEKKYNVKVPHTYLYYWKKLDGGLSFNDLAANAEYDALKFTEAEIEHYGLQDCEKEEATDDGE
ncbi:DUF1642 domain-containing protein [Loigolactobacillus coryniformis]|uniref:DUF1642 domain-containing protein n=1 Tax=Loigolactobacillus coryniformis TaxID=1610 RepID=UPI003F29E287